MPWSGPRSVPPLSALSAARASARARSGATRMNERSRLSSASMRSRSCSVTATGLSPPARIRAARSAIDANAIGVSSMCATLPATARDVKGLPPGGGGAAQATRFLHGLSIGAGEPTDVLVAAAKPLESARQERGLHEVVLDPPTAREAPMGAHPRLGEGPRLVLLRQAHPQVVVLDPEGEAGEEPPAHEVAPAHEH